METTNLMRKLREDSTWSQLTIEQRQLLDHWLFEENLGYAEARARVHSEFDVDATIPSVGRYYRRRARERQGEELVSAYSNAVGLNSLPYDIATLREAAVKLAGAAALKQAAEKPNEPEHLVAFTRLLLESEENELRRAKIKLAQQQFDYETIAPMVPELPHLRRFLVRIGDDDSLNEEEKMRRFHAVLFGKDNPWEIIKGFYTSTLPEGPLAEWKRSNKKARKRKIRPKGGTQQEPKAET